MYANEKEKAGVLYSMQAVLKPLLPRLNMADAENIRKGLEILAKTECGEEKNDNGGCTVLLEIVQCATRYLSGEKRIDDDRKIHVPDQKDSEMAVGFWEYCGSHEEDEGSPLTEMVRYAVRYLFGEERTPLPSDQELCRRYWEYYHKICERSE